MTNAERQKAYRARRNVTPVTRPPVTLTETLLRAQVKDLQDEVVRLKRELAEAHAKAIAWKPLKVPAPRPKAEAAEGTLHGPRCQGVCCRLKRAKGKK